MTTIPSLSADGGTLVFRSRRGRAVRCRSRRNLTTSQETVMTQTPADDYPVDQS